MKRLTYILLLLALTLHVSAASWTTHFAYNSVDNIAAGGGEVFGVSSGSLFSVDAQTEKITTFSQGSGITCIQWIEPIQSLMIMYGNGKMDLLRDGQFQPVLDLYNKYTTLSKYCHSVTVRDSLAYLAMDYGVQTFNFHKREFVDTYFIGAGGKEVPVYSIALTGHTIYAAADSVLYAASMDDNIVDYSYWSEISLPAKGNIQAVASANGVLYLLHNNLLYRQLTDGEEHKGWQLVDSQKYNALNVIDGEIYPSPYPTVSHQGLWMAAGEQGMLRRMETGEVVKYRIDSPLNNHPYRLSYQQGKLYMFNGGRWAVQYKNPGNVMLFDGKSWCNITHEEIRKQIGDHVGDTCLDCMNVAVDPVDPEHFFVTSYGTGLYEFKNNTCIKRWNHKNSIIRPAVANKYQLYTRLDGAIYDAHGNLWVMNTGYIDYNIIIFTADGKQIGLNINQLDGSRYIIHTAGQFIFDNRNPNYVWALVPRGSDAEAGLALIDTKGTIDNPADDRTLIRVRWTDQDGNSLTRDAIYTMRQDEQGNIWLATRNGILVIPAEEDYFTSNRCYVLHTVNSDGLLIFDEQQINDVEFDNYHRPWVATDSAGVYVLSADGTSAEEHFSIWNTPMPSNNVQSLAYDATHACMYVGTDIGLVAYHEYGTGFAGDNESASSYPDYGSTGQWKTHFAYTNVKSLQVSKTHVYALSEGSLCAIDKADESLTYYSKLTGLSSSSIQRIGYDANTQNLMIIYDDGMIDLLDEKEVAHPVADLYLKQLNTTKKVQDIAFYQGKAYMAMPFGITVLNIRKREISDTYYIGEEGSEIPVNAVAIWRDSIFASSGNLLYGAPLTANLVDYSQWSVRQMPGNITHMVTYGKNMYMLMDSLIYLNYYEVPTKITFTNLTADLGTVLAFHPSKIVLEVKGFTVTKHAAASAFYPYCAVKDGSTYWLGTSEGIIHLMANGSVQKYQPEGPSSNTPYSMTTSGRLLWVVPGGRWAVQYKNPGKVMRYNGEHWNNIANSTLRQKTGATALRDFGHVAVDPGNTEHYYVACFGTGLLEFLPDGEIKQYTYTNSPLVTLVPDKNPHLYCRVDAITFDADRNLWLTNTGASATNIHVIDPQNQWHSFNLYQGGQRIVLNTVSKILIDNRNENYKWIASAREDAGLVLLNDNGTPYNGSDDRSVFRASFVDQDGKGVSVARLNTIAQDHNGDLWLGTEEGILIIEAATDMFHSNACKRMKISRHDGTNLADYLLGTEQINAIVFAGGNRIWIGTEESGAYLVHMVTKEGIYEPEILAHFTSLNSPMPSDRVLSIAIDERGEVYIGTAKGLVSYRGDATDPEDTYSDAYVYPNPVRPNYEGDITIAGLMDNTTVFIADAAGNVVCRTHSNGGTAVWDGKTQAGKKVHSGVYTVYCNTADGQNHTVLKLLIMH